MHSIRRGVLAVTTAGLLCLFGGLSAATAVASPASPASSASPARPASSASPASPASGVKGDPQPELKPFKIGATTYGSGGGSVAIEPNGTLVVAYGVTTGDGKVVVCILARGATKCSHTTTLSPLNGVDLFGHPEVFTPSANHIVLLMETCCESNPDGDLLFTSTDGGLTWGAPVRVGSLSVSTATLIGNQILFSPGDDHDGTEVEAIPVTASGPPASTAIPNAKVAYDIGDGSYRGGALVASDNLTSDYTTYVEYAPSGDNFNATGSYHNVGSFAHEQLIGISGDALLTEKTTGTESLELRLFNGTGFGAPHAVPGDSGTGPGWFTVEQDPSGRVHVFSSRAFSPVSYDLYEVSTVNGSAWSAAVNLGNAIVNDYFNATLDRSGSGLVLGTYPAWGYPVLGTQSASFSLKASTIKKGHAVAASGKASPVAKGRTVDLQVERSGLWYTIGSTHENASGAFAFTIKPAGTGTFVYRAVVSDLAGYLQFGYSPARALRVTS
jgi:hypothetical protein